MESQAEREWLDSAEGGFQEFFNSLLNQTQPTTDAVEFLENFNDIKTIFTHATKINTKELQLMKTHSHTIVHCPISNRLLGNGALDIDSLDNASIPWICATDGLSSNYKLDLLEEIKCALFMHHSRPLLPLAKKLLRSITKDAADALGVNSGEIKEGRNADMLVFDLEKKPTPELPIHLILHRYNIAKIYINGALV
jgi:cytosine/adenosine deaminase-related metal-dependent hydrolase